MLLDPQKSLCKINQLQIVSRDKGNSRKHHANNPRGRFDVRQYKLDGELIKQQKCCDYLLLNDSGRKAYLIELKGGNIDEAIEQLRAGESKCREELKEYVFFYRIVCSKVRTHKINSNKFRKFKDECGVRLKYKENILEEVLD